MLPKIFDCRAAGVTVIALGLTVGLSDAVEFAYVADVVGVNVADNDVGPRSTGTQSHVATDDTVATDTQPVMGVPFKVNVTVPARDAVPVMRFVTRYWGDASASTKPREVAAYPIVIVKFSVVAVAPLASVTVTETVDVPIVDGVPVIDPVEGFSVSPLTNVPVSP